MNTKDFKTRSETIHRAAPCPANHWVIGLDIGYSAIKGMSPNKIYSVPAYARKIPADRVRLNEPSETDIYYKAENGDIWVVGSLAYNELSASDVIDSEQELFGRKRYYSDMFRVISDTGIAIGLMGNDKGNSKGKKLTIQTGLPPKYLKADQNDLKEVLSGHHHFSLRIGRAPWQQFDFVVDSKDIFVMPQPLGALVSALVGKDGKQLATAAKIFSKNTIVFDPGFGTCDDYLVDHGSVVDENTFPDFGMREVFSRTRKKIQDTYGVSLQIPDLQNLLETGEVRILDRKHMKRSNESFRTLLEDASREVCDETIEKLKSTHNYFADIDYIVATGGTYDAWSEQFNNVFRYMDGLQIIPGNINDPDLSNIYSNVRGYYYQRVNQIR